MRRRLWTKKKEQYENNRVTRVYAYLVIFSGDVSIAKKMLIRITNTCKSVLDTKSYKQRSWRFLTHRKQICKILIMCVLSVMKL